MIGRFVCAVGCLLAICAVYGARQAAAPAVPAQQASAATDVISLPEIDALAKTVMQKVRAGKITSLVLVGGGTFEFKVSELGVSLRDGLNEALARQAAGVRVFSSADVREVLKRNRVSESMIYCNPLADWIAARTNADGVVAIELERVKDGHATVAVKLFDEHQKRVIDKKTKTVIPYAKLDGEIPLTESEESASTRDYFERINAQRNFAGTKGISMPYCAFCPRPEYSSEAKHYLDHWTIYFVVTVRPDGLADEIRVTRPVGLGTEGDAINALLTWKFKPSIDASGNPVAAKVPIEIQWQIY